MAELLLELFSEEIPARMQARASADLQRLVTDGLKKAGLEFDSATAFVTPRRLALVVDGLPTAQPDVSEERKGPNVNAPEKAQEGFRRSLPEGAKVEERELPKGTFFFAIIEKKGQATRDVLPQVLADAVNALPWPKSMRWGAGNFKWVRPLHSILCLFDGTVVEFEVGGVTSSNTTKGHRFLSSGALTVKDFADYQAKLLDAKVMLDQEARRTKILDDARHQAGEMGLQLKEDLGLLAEVTGLVEWPVVLTGQIDIAFMDVPPEVLTTAMRAHQKYFSVLNADASLAPHFIVVANTEATDANRSIVAGNERVLRARLSDAKFFWDQDRKKPLETRLPALADSVFHAKLGTMAAKSERIGVLAGRLCHYIHGAERDQAVRAGGLSKADLTSEMVYEFPELQGIMGRYYALNDDEAAEVADAIADHYAPQGPSDDCPTAPISVAVALADKIDTLVGFFGIDEKPTGSKDPYALRRAALGIIRLIIENSLRLPLEKAFEASHGLYEGQAGKDGDGVSEALLDFFADRLKVHLKEKGVRHDLISAVFSLGGEDDLVRLLARVDALTDFLGTDDGANLLTAYRRAANILRIEEKKDGCSYDADPDPALLAQDEEKTLHAALIAARADCGPAIEEERFADAMSALARLRQPVDAFFDNVTVNCNEKELRENRLKLLSHIRSALAGVADFSQIEGG